MPKYFVQRDSFRCGAIAYMNLLIWLGYPRTRKNIGSAENAVKCLKSQGIDDEDMHKALKKLKSIRVTRRWSWTNRELLDRLHKNRPIILSFYHTGDLGHVCFIPGFDPESKRYMVTNLYQGVEYSLLTKKQLLKLCSSNCFCWFITRKAKKCRS